MPKVREWERRMVCRECDRTIDVLRAPKDGSPIWEGRADRDLMKMQMERKRVPLRATGFFPRHLLGSHVPAGLLADPAFALAYCHPEKCGRVIPLDVYDVARMCREAESGRFEV